MRRVFVFPALAAVFRLTGCGTSARYVAKQGDSGVVAIPADTNDWPTHYRQQAEELIRRHVGPDFEIVEGHEVVTGSATTNNQQVQRDKTFNTTNPFLPAEKDTVSTTTTSRDITEYQITYRRRPGAAAGVAPAGGVQQAGGSAPAGVIPSVLPAGGPAPADAALYR